MGKIDFRDGSLTGKYLGMVGAAWKGISYVRKFVIPANPNSTDQQGARAAFAGLVAKGRRINSTILKDFIIPKPKGMSPFNEFIRRNQAMIEALAFTYSDMKIGIGGLFAFDTLAVDTASNTEFILTWQDTLQGEALATDTLIVVVYNESTDSYYFSTTIARSVETLDVGAVGSTGNTYHCWAFPVQGSSISGETVYFTGTLA